MGKKFDLSWDLSSGFAEGKSADQSGELQIVAGPTLGPDPSDPGTVYDYTDGETQDWIFDIFGLDRRMALVWAHYLKPAQWWLDFWGTTRARPDPITDISISAVLIVKDARGSVREIGPYPSTVWLNGGVVAADGIEIVSGAQGVRFKVHVVFHGADAWDMCAKLQLKPDQPLGCEGLGQAIASAYSAVVPPQLQAAQFVVGG